MPPRRVPARASPAERALARLKVLCAEVPTSGSDSRWSPSLASLRAAADDVDVLIAQDAADNDCSGLWAAVGEDGIAPLLALHAVVLRRSSASLTPELSEELRAAHGALRAKLTASLANPKHLGRGGDVRKCTTAIAVVRSHALQCYARLLADSWAQLSQRRSRRTVQAAMAMLAEALDLLTALVRRKCVARPPLPELGAALGDALQLELPASGLLEHWARLLLLAAPPGDDAEEEAAMLLANMAKLLDLAGSLVVYAGRSRMRDPCMSYLLTSHVVRLCAALDGGCSHGLGQEDVWHGAPLFDAEGGALRLGSGQCAGTSLAQLALDSWSDAIHLRRPAAAKPAEASSSLPAGAGSPPAVDVSDWRAHRGVRPAVAVLARASSELQLRLESQMAIVCKAEASGTAEASPELQAQRETLATQQAEVAKTKAQQESNDAQRALLLLALAPPLHMQAVYRLAMRLVVCGTDAAAAAAPPPPPSGVGGRRATAPARRLRVAEAEALPLAMCALKCAREASRCVARAAALQPRDQERLRGYWAAALRLAAAVQQSTAAGASFLPSGVGDALKPQVPDSCLGATGLPPGPTPDVAAALAAGWVPLTERLLQSAPPGRVMQLMSLRGPRCDLQPEAWAQVLAFGDPREVAALVATAGRRLHNATGATRGECSAAPEAGPSLGQLEGLAFWASPLPVRCCMGPPRPAGPEAAAGDAAAAAAAAAGCGAGRAPTAAADPSSGRLAVAAGGAASQLRLLMSWVALRTLEPLARALQAVVLRDLPVVGGQVEGPTGAGLLALVGFALDWVTVLAGAVRAAADAAAGSGAAAAEVEAAEAAGREWRHVLRWELGLGRVLGMGLEVARSQAPGTTLTRRGRAPLRNALLTLAALQPSELARVVRAADAAALKEAEAAASKEAEAAEGAGSAAGAVGAAGRCRQLRPTTQLLRSVLGPGGACCEPGLLAAVMRVCDAGAGGDAGGQGARAAEAGAEAVPLTRWLTALLAGGGPLAAPAEARKLLRTCDSPACGRMDIPARTLLTFQKYHSDSGWYGGVNRYCNERCSEAHLHAGRAERG